MNLKKLSELKEPLEVNIQLMAVEMDTSAVYLRCIAKEFLEDSVEIERFDKLIREIEFENGVEITSIDDNTVMYEFKDEAIIIHTVLGVKYLIFDTAVKHKIFNAMEKYEIE